jgi:hypothetical protein
VNPGRDESGTWSTVEPRFTSGASGSWAPRFAGSFLSRNPNTVNLNFEVVPGFEDTCVECEVASAFLSGPEVNDNFPVSVHPLRDRRLPGLVRQVYQRGAVTFDICTHPIRRFRLDRSHLRNVVRGGVVAPWTNAWTISRKTGRHAAASGCSASGSLMACGSSSCTGPPRTVAPNRRVRRRPLARVLRTPVIEVKRGPRRYLELDRAVLATAKDMLTRRDRMRTIDWCWPLAVVHEHRPARAAVVVTDHQIRSAVCAWFGATAEMLSLTPCDDEDRCDERTRSESVPGSRGPSSSNVLPHTRAVLHTARATREDDTTSTAANGTASGAAAVLGGRRCDDPNGLILAV